MAKTDTTTDKPTGLDALADEAAMIGVVTEKPAAPPQEDIDAEKSMAAVEAGFQAVLLGLLKIGRAFVAKHLPEIQEEWTDEALAAPTVTAMPLVRKHLAGLMQIVGSSPELAAFAISLIPLGLGVITAMDKASKRQQQAPAAPEPEVLPATGG